MMIPKTEIILRFGYTGVNEFGEREYMEVLQASKKVDGFLPEVSFFKVRGSLAFRPAEFHRVSLSDESTGSDPVFHVERNYEFYCNGKENCKMQYDFILNTLKLSCYEIGITTHNWDELPELEPMTLKQEQKKR